MLIPSWRASFVFKKLCSELLIVGALPLKNVKPLFGVYATAWSLVSGYRLTSVGKVLAVTPSA